MPLVIRPPDLFLEHNGVEVYHTYQDGFDESPYWFTLNPDNSDECFGHRSHGHFDARRLVGRWSGTPNVAQWDEWWKARHVSEEAALEAIIEAAIESGNLTPENTGACPVPSSAAE